jgi:DNA-binding response OmpR family regulator
MQSSHIVIVEDNRLLQEALADHLREQGFSVHTLSDGKGLDALLLEQPVDLLILDLNLPLDDGGSIAMRVRKTHADLSILILSARLPVQPELAWMQSVDLMIRKPVLPQELTAAAHRLCVLTHSRRP